MHNGVKAALFHGWHRFAPSLCSVSSSVYCEIQSFEISLNPLTWDLYFQDLHELYISLRCKSREKFLLVVNKVHKYRGWLLVFSEQAVTCWKPHAASVDKRGQ